MTAYVVDPADRVAGEITVPGDKSVSHRAVMLGALADGRTRVTGFLEGEDCLSTMQAVAHLGVHLWMADQAAVGHGLSAPGRGVAGGTSAARLGVGAHAAQHPPACPGIERPRAKEAAALQHQEGADDGQGEESRDDAAGRQAAQPSFHRTLVPMGISSPASPHQGRIVQGPGDVDQCRGKERHAQGNVHRVPGGQGAPGSDRPPVSRTACGGRSGGRSGVPRRVDGQFTRCASCAAPSLARRSSWS